MSIFNINYSTLWKQLLPPILRQPIQEAWGTSLTEPLQINNDLFNEYINGSTGYTAYNNSTTYSVGTRVYYTDDAIYENLSGSTGVLPTNTNYWIQVNPNFIGAIERSNMNARKMTFEYALNRQFRTTGFAPKVTIPINQNTFAASANTIYIKTTPIPAASFMMGETGTYSSTMSNESKNATSWMGNTYTGTTTSCFTIYVPNYIYTATTEPIIRNYVDQINMGGMLYTVTGY